MKEKCDEQISEIQIVKQQKERNQQQQRGVCALMVEALTTTTR